MTWYNEQPVGCRVGADPKMKFLSAFISMQNRDKRRAQALDLTR
jgi:hypothetical protein